MNGTMFARRNNRSQIKAGELLVETDNNQPTAFTTARMTGNA
jgi:hypothetical protein